MFGRSPSLFVLLAAAIAVPYFAGSTTDLFRKGSTAPTTNKPGVQNAGRDGLAGARPPAIDPRRPLLSGAPLTSGPDAERAAMQVQPQPLERVLRFDLSAAWIISQWPRVSAGLGELDRQGYRVPLVTGTSEADVAGSLTYYFNKQQQIDRITLHGATGDPRRLVMFVTSQYGLERQATDDPGLHLYQAKWNGKPQSELRIRTARVVRVNTPNARFEVDLNLKRTR